MQSDDLIRFAAEKLGVKLSHDADHEFYWFAECWETYNTGDDFDLSSPDLFIKGLGVAHNSKLNITICTVSLGKWCVNIIGDTGYADMRGEVSDIPVLFWACWFKLEKGGA